MFNARKHHKQILNKQLFAGIYLKEVFQPHVHVQLPCYDLTPVTNIILNKHSISLQKYYLQITSASVIWRAVRTKLENIFNAACWSAFTSDSVFMGPSFRTQSVLRYLFSDLLDFIYYSLATHCRYHCNTCVAQFRRPCVPDFVLSFL
jgi:hypothetical protein